MMTTILIQLIAFVSMVTLRTASTSSAFSEYNSNNIREHNIVNNNSIQVGTHCYLVCIPTLPNDVTKMAVARAVERRILYSSLGEIKYVKNVILVQGFDENLKNTYKDIGLDYVFSVNPTDGTIILFSELKTYLRIYVK